MKKTKRLLHINFFIMFLLMLVLGSSCSSNNKRSTEKNATNQVEKNIYSTLISNDNNEDKTNKIFNIIDRIDWLVYLSVSNNNSIELLDFLEKNYINANEIGKINLFKATNKLDGMYAERYSSIVGNLFLSDKKSTIKIISKLDPSKYKEMINYILFSISPNDKSLIKNDIKQLKELDITENERRVADLMLEGLGKSSS